MTREEIINEYLKEHRHDVLLNPYAGLLDFAKYLDEHSELPGGLEEAAEKHSRANMYDGWDYERIYNAFIAGAEWGMNQMPLPEDTTIFLKGVAEDKRLMMEGAVGGRYMKADDKVYVESWPLDIDPDSVKAGDEVRLIVLPKED